MSVKRNLVFFGYVPVMTKTNFLKLNTHLFQTSEHCFFIESKQKCVFHFLFGL